MSEEFNEFLARQMKLHAKRVGMKKGGAHPYSWHSAKAAAFEAWEYKQVQVDAQQKVIEHQQARIDELTSQVDLMTEIIYGVEDSFTTYSVEFKHSDPRGSMKRLIKTVEKMALDPAISHRANKLREDAVREAADAFKRMEPFTHKIDIKSAWAYMCECADKIERGEA